MGCTSCLRSRNPEVVRSDLANYESGGCHSSGQNGQPVGHQSTTPRHARGRRKEMSGNKCRDDTVEKRLLRKTNKSPSCWIWTGGTFSDGYGNIGTSKGARRAHRVSYELYVGPIPDGMQVLHSCDTPRCINPAHLSLGTAADNMRDRDLKGRHVACFGERNGTSRLSDSCVRVIRSSPLTTSELAQIFDVCTHTIRRVIAGITWSHI